MSSIQVFSLDNAAKWDAIVRSFEKYDVYYLSGYVKAFQLHGDGEPMLFYYEANDLRGINVVMRRDISKCPHFSEKLRADTYFDIVTPYGYGGWLVEGVGDWTALWAEYSNLCCQQGIVSEFVRFHPVLENDNGMDNFYSIVQLGSTVCIDLTSPEIIWSNLTSKNRNMIRKAEKSGVKIFIGRSQALYKTFREIYNATMDKDRADLYYYFKPAFYDSISQDLPCNAQVFYAQKDGEVIAASILLAANGRLNYHLSGSRREYQSLAPTNLLLYEAAIWGNVNGCRTMHLGGGVGSGKDNLYAFKKAFNRGEPYPYFIGRKVFLNKEYDMLCAKRKFCSESSFFPLYRS